MNKQVILSQLLDQLKTITKANGYVTDIGLRALYWEVYDKEYESVPSVSFYDRNVEIVKNNQVYVYLTKIQVFAISFTREENKLVDGCGLLADLEKAIIQTRWWDEPLIVRPISQEKEIQGKGRQAIRVIFDFEIETREIVN